MGRKRCNIFFIVFISFFFSSCFTKTNSINSQFLLGSLADRKVCVNFLEKEILIRLKKISVDENLYLKIKELRHWRGKDGRDFVFNIEYNGSHRREFGSFQISKYLDKKNIEHIRYNDRWEGYNVFGRTETKFSLLMKAEIIKLAKELPSSICRAKDVRVIQYLIQKPKQVYP